RDQRRGRAYGLHQIDWGASPKAPLGALRTRSSPANRSDFLGSAPALLPIATDSTHADHNANLGNSPISYVCLTNLRMGSLRTIRTRRMDVHIMLFSFWGTHD